MDNSGVQVADKCLTKWLFVAVAAIFLVFQQGAITNSDGASMFAVTKSMVEHRSVAVPPELGVQGRDQVSYSRYGLGLSLVAVPAVGAAALLSSVVGSQENLQNAAAASTMPLIAAGLVIALFALGRRLGGSRPMAVLVAVGAVVGTYFLPYTKDFFAEPLAAVGVVFSIERLFARRPLTAGAWLAIACLARPQTLLFAPLFSTVMWWQLGLKNAVKSALPVLASGVLMGAYNFQRFGNIADFGYSDVPAFSNPFLHGASGLLFDPAKSVFLFAPILILIPAALASLWKRNAAAAILLGGNLLITFVITSLWFSWQGGWAWGPRLLIPGVAPMISVLAPWLSSRRRVVLVSALLGLGLAISASTVLVPTQAQQLAKPQPENGPLVVSQIRLVPRVTAYTLSHLYEPNRPGDGSHRRFLGLWQFNIARTFGSRGLAGAAVATIALLALAVVGARRVGSELAQPNEPES
jgi:hypothetical protein